VEPQCVDPTWNEWLWGTNVNDTMYANNMHRKISGIKKD
jgi:hypothetical protein